MKRYVNSKNLFELSYRPVCGFKTLSYRILCFNVLWNVNHHVCMICVMLECTMH